MRVLAHLAWPLTVRETFFKQKTARLPEITYPAFNAKDIALECDKIQSEFHANEITDQWLWRQAEALKNTALMLENTNSADFYHYSSKLYGTPNDPLTDGSSTVLTLAKEFDHALDYFIQARTPSLKSPTYHAKDAAIQLEQAVAKLFGDDRPEVLIVDNLSANATASARRIRLRAEGEFSGRFIQQLIQHEASIHVATAINGRQQYHLPTLGLSHPGTTRTQEGLAVFAEFITGSIDLDRMRRLSDRVIAIQMAVDGANFLEVYRYFNEHIEDPIQAFENTRRIFRGGVLTGGAPFTKDMVYLGGLLNVHNFLRAVVAVKRIDVIPLLFCGKLDIEDLPALMIFHRNGLCNEAKYKPSWIDDTEFLLSYLAYSSFLNQIKMDNVEDHYRTMLNRL